MIYARIEADGSITLHDLDPALIAKWVAESNRKALVHRPLAIDTQPAASATQIIVDAGYVIEPTQVRQTWALREKTADEIEVGDVLAERDKLPEIIADLKTQRDVTRAQWDAFTANQLRAEQWRDRQVLLRLASMVARSMKQGLR
jgi:hypothetical protein